MQGFGPTWRECIDLLLEGLYHLGWEGLALLPDINKLLDFVLHQTRGEHFAGGFIYPSRCHVEAGGFAG